MAGEERESEKLNNKSSYYFYCLLLLLKGWKKRMDFILKNIY